MIRGLRHHPGRFFGTLLGVGLGLVLLAAPLSAQGNPAMTAREAGRMLQDAAAALDAADGARDRVEALTETVRAYEHGLEALRAGLRAAAVRERTILLVFEAERERLGQLMGILQRIGRTPAPAVLLHPEGALDTARLGMIVSDVTPAVAGEARALRGQLEELAVLREVREVAMTQLENAAREVQAARADLSQAIADRIELPERFALNVDAMQQIVESVGSLDAFAEALGATFAATTADLPDFEAARGTLPLPVLGSLLRDFGEADAAGISRPGVIYAVPPQALLTAPWSASIRYAGPLLDYGNVIILEPQADYLIILAGLGDVFVAAGDLVASDAPLGLMPGEGGESSTELIVSESQGGGVGLTETLYMEMRQGGSPVDPMEWFAAR